MECEKYINLMNERLDGTISQTDDRELTAHLEECESCRGLFAVMSEIQKEIGNMTEEPPEELSRVVMNRIEEDKGVQKSRRFMWRKFTAVAAAAVALILIAYYVLPNFKSNDSANTSAVIADSEKESADLEVQTEIMKDALEESVTTQDMQSDSAAPQDATNSDTEGLSETDGNVSEPTAFMAPPALPYSQNFSAILVYSGIMPEELEGYTIEQGTETEYFVFVPSDELEPLLESGNYTVFSEGSNISDDAEFAIVVVYGGLAEQ